MYEMFLGPLELSKPWDTHGIEGVYRFLRKVWNLCHPGGNFNLAEGEAPEAAYKILHKTIKKVEEDIDRFSFNTSVSQFMICVNELSSLKANHPAIVRPLLAILAPFAPFICEELWHKAGFEDSVLTASWPQWEEKYLIENVFEYPVSENGKLRTKISLPLDMDAKAVEAAVMADEYVQKVLNGRTPKKVVVVHGRIVNLVV
jgi:leucyl-tRNA synthetase